MIETLENAYGMNILDIIYTMEAVFVISGIVGFVYEELFYRIDLRKWVKRGATFGPWILIYSIGGILLAFIVYHFRAHWIVVFLLSALITGFIEYIAGYLILKLTGKRYWDYNMEIWSWGNIGGFVAARSVIIFGIGGIALVYLIFPIVIRVFESPHGEAWKHIMMVLFFVYIFDLILHRAMKIPVYCYSEDQENIHAKTGQ
ncbi:MAG: putative ABC transporter permease [Lachnospiraceae bacterium]|nr:putative ABC transporter permease [Lachnospiraceae bacterium]